MKAKRIAFLSICTALAMILSYVESLLPIFAAVPGMKIGLANLVTIFLLYRCRWWEAFLVSFVRVILTGLLFGTAYSMAFSAAGFLLSFTCMALLVKTKRFHAVSVSAAGGVMHNVAQIVVAIFLLGVSEIMYYLPVLILTGTGFGVLLGVLGGILVKRLPASPLERTD